MQDRLLFNRNLGTKDLIVSTAAFPDTAQNRYKFIKSGKGTLRRMIKPLSPSPTAVYLLKGG